MSLIDQIHDSFIRHCQRYTDEPTVIYLGNWEYRELLHNCESFLSFERKDGQLREKVHGLSIYRVIEEHHLRVV